MRLPSKRVSFDDLSDRLERPNKALDPTAVSVSIFMRFDFTEFFSYPDRVVPAVGQLDRSAPFDAPGGGS